MPIGTLFSWFADRGYGFLEPDTGNRARYFVHVTEMNRAGVKPPIIGMPFAWEASQRNGKPYAVGVEPLKPFKAKDDATEDNDDSDD